MVKKTLYIEYRKFMDEFFDSLKKIGIKSVADVPSVIFNLKLKKLIDFAINSYILINKTTTINRTGKNVFNFSVNEQLAGGERPCSEITCRLNRAIELAKFTALYANTISIPPFFDYIERYNFNFKNNTQIQFFYNRVAGDLVILLFYKPLIDLGLIKINSRFTVLCREHLQKTRREEKLLYKKIDIIKKRVSGHIAKKVRFKLDEKQALVITPSEYAGTEVLRFAILPREFKKYCTNLPHIFSQDEVKKLKLVEKSVLSEVLDGLILQKYSIRSQGLNYLTNLEIDADVINFLDPKNQIKNINLVKNLTHELPLISGVSIEEIIKLRRAETEYFERYRDAIQEVIKNIQTEKSGEKINEAVSDLVIPEIHKIEKMIKVNRDFFLKKAKNKVIFNSILISAGIFSNQIFGINFAEIFKAFGFAQVFAIKEIYDDVSLAIQTPKEAINNDWYFLWKLKKGGQDRQLLT